MDISLLVNEMYGLINISSHGTVKTKFFELNKCVTHCSIFKQGIEMYRFRFRVMLCCIGLKANILHFKFNFGRRFHNSV